MLLVLLNIGVVTLLFVVPRIVPLQRTPPQGPHWAGFPGVWMLWFVLLVTPILVIRQLLFMVGFPIRIREGLAMAALLLTFFVFGYAQLFQVFGVKDAATNSVTHAGTAALYLSVMTITTVGYGDVVPANAWARWLAMAEPLSGYFVTGVLIAVLVATAGGFRMPGSRQRPESQALPVVYGSNRTLVQATCQC